MSFLPVVKEEAEESSVKSEVRQNFFSFKKKKFILLFLDYLCWTRDGGGKHTQDMKLGPFRGQGVLSS